MELLFVSIGMALCCFFEWNERRDRPKRRAYIVKCFDYLLQIESEHKETLKVIRDRAINEPTMNQKKADYYETDLVFWVTLIKYPEKFNLCEKTKNEI